MINCLLANQNLALHWPGLCSADVVGYVELSQPNALYPTKVNVNLPQVEQLLIIEGDCEGGVVYDPHNVSTIDQGKFSIYSYY